MKKVFVYHDADHGDIEVFSSLKTAKAYTEEHWSFDETGEDDWVKEGDLYTRGEYVSISIKDIK